MLAPSPKPMGSSSVLEPGSASNKLGDAESDPSSSSATNQEKSIDGTGSATKSAAPTTKSVVAADKGEVLPPVPVISASNSTSTTTVVTTSSDTSSGKTTTTTTVTTSSPVNTAATDPNTKSSTSAPSSAPNVNSGPNANVNGTATATSEQAQAPAPTATVTVEVSNIMPNYTEEDFTPIPVPNPMTQVQSTVPAASTLAATKSPETTAVAAVPSTASAMQWEPTEGGATDALNAAVAGASQVSFPSANPTGAFTAPPPPPPPTQVATNVSPETPQGTTSRTVSASTLPTSMSEASLVPSAPASSPPPLLTVPSSSGDPHASINFSASGFANVPANCTSPTPSQQQQRQAATAFHPLRTQSSTSMDVSLTPVNSSNNLAPSPQPGTGPASYTFSPGSADGGKGLGGGVNQHRQKRLERNRESARLSRRRRKQYLEVLEERVSTMSEQMDAGRREHVRVAIPSLRRLRSDRLAEAERDLFGLMAASGGGGDRDRSQARAIIPKLEEHLTVLGTTLSRTADELRIMCEFQKEQLKSLIIPPYTRFVLWVTLQNEAFFRGGRAPSERLSAARIGERMLSAGNDRVPPSNGMWPLFCNEVGLSYEQEEKVRAYQRALLVDKKSWVQRHTTRATGASIQSSHRAINGLSEMVRRREASLLSVLTIEQRVRFLAWAKRRSDSIRNVMKNITVPTSLSSDVPDFVLDENLQPSPERHDAANLYIVDKNLQAVQMMLPTVPSLVGRKYMKKMSRRPSFESLGSHAASNNKMESSSSSGSLAKKRAISFDDGNGGPCPVSPLTPSNSSNRLTGLEHAGSTPPQVTPEAAQAAAAQEVIDALGPIAVALRIPRPAPMLMQLHIPQPRPPQLVSSSSPHRSVSACYAQPQTQQPQTPVPVQSRQQQHPVVTTPVPSSSYVLAQKTHPSSAPARSSLQKQPAQPQQSGTGGFVLTVPVPSTTASVGQSPQQQQQKQHQQHKRVPSGPQTPASAPGGGHKREISLLNSPLPSCQEDLFMKIVTEEADPTGSSSQADQFLFELTEGDWAIGGFDQ